MYIWRINNKDNWSDIFSTIEECIEDARQEKETIFHMENIIADFDEIEVAKAIPHQFEVDAYSILEKIEEELWEDFDMEYYFSDDVSQEDILELEECLTETLNKWFEKTNTKPNVFDIVENSIEIIKIN